MTFKSMLVFHRLLVLALIIGITSPLVACGRKGSPAHPGDSEYLQSYQAP